MFHFISNVTSSQMPPSMCSSPGKVTKCPSPAGGQASYSLAYGICHQHLDSWHIRTQQQSHTAQQPQNTWPEPWLHRHTKSKGREETPPENTHNTKSSEKEHFCQQLPPGNKSFLSVLHDVISVTITPAPRIQGYWCLQLLVT